MKRLGSLGIAVILVVVIVFGLFAFAHSHLNLKSSKFGMWVDEDKFSSYQMLNENMTEDDILVFGSSEFRHGQGTDFYPKKMMKGQKGQFVVVGREYYQCLTHATTLAAMSPEMKNKKVVLILSPQWFAKEGVNAAAFSKRFSQNNYLGMLDNSSVSSEDKQYIMDRTEKLLSCDSKLAKNIEQYNKEYSGEKQSLIESVGTKFNKKFQEEKSIFTAVTKAYISGVAFDSESEDASNKEIDWEYYREKARKIGIQKTNKNEFNVNDKFFKSDMEKSVAGLKGFKSDLSFDESPEYDDLKCFLNICRDNNIEVLIISTPINGKWYDYAGFSKEKRESYYSKIRDVVNEYDVEFKDLSVNEYKDGYFFDTVHFGWEGWVDVNEAIYRFQNGD